MIEVKSQLTTDHLNFGQEFTLADEVELTHVELSAIAQAWKKEEAIATGSGIIVSILDGRTEALLAVGTTTRERIPTKEGEWVAITLENPVLIEPNQTYVLRVSSSSRGGAVGWNEYGFNPKEKKSYKSSSDTELRSGVAYQLYGKKIH